MRRMGNSNVVTKQFFCQNASPLVKATAAVIDRDFRKYYILGAFAMGAVTVALKVSSARAKMSSDAKNLSYLSYYTGLTTAAMTFITIRFLN